MSRRVTFPGADGSDLVGVLEVPTGTARATALFAHCFTCSKDLKSARRLSQELVEHGLRVLRFDFTGLGESAGAFSETNFTSNVGDLVAAADWLREQGSAPQVLIGHSLGGAAVLAAAPRIEESRAVVTIGAPSDPSHLRESVLKEVDPEAERTEVVLAGRRFVIKRELFEDLDGVHLVDQLPKLRRALLVMHSPIDELVSIEHAATIYGAAKHPKSFVALDGADHLLLDREQDVEFAARMMSAWLERYVPEPALGRGDEPSEVSPVPPGAVVVAGKGGDFLQTVTTSKHQFQADEPVSLGGGDRGPNPYELLLASLGSCISMTLGMYARRKEIPLEAVRVQLEHNKVHARECEDCESENGLVDIITKSIELQGDLTEEQRNRLLEISARCPVHRTLTTETRVVSMAQE